jgi:hypothetical protein
LGFHPKPLPTGKTVFAQLRTSPRLCSGALKKRAAVLGETPSAQLLSAK